MQCDLEERLTVMGDRDHLYRVVYNLTDNAVKFIEDGGTLRLKVHQEGQLCVFAISNTGIGLRRRSCGMCSTASTRPSRFALDG